MAQSKDGGMILVVFMVIGITAFIMGIATGAIYRWLYPILMKWLGA